MSSEGSGVYGKDFAWIGGSFTHCILNSNMILSIPKGQKLRNGEATVCTLETSMAYQHTIVCHSNPSLNHQVVSDLQPRKCRFLLKDNQCICSNPHRRSTASHVSSDRNCYVGRLRANFEESGAFVSTYLIYLPNHKILIHSTHSQSVASCAPSKRALSQCQPLKIFWKTNRYQNQPRGHGAHTERGITRCRSITISTWMRKVWLS